MHVITFLLLAISLLRSYVLCDTRFIHPPDWRDDEDNRRNPEKNRRYLDGEMVKLEWETDNEDAELWLVQDVESMWEFFPLDCK